MGSGAIPDYKLTFLLNIFLKIPLKLEYLPLDSRPGRCEYLYEPPKASFRIGKVFGFKTFTENRRGEKKFGGVEYFIIGIT